MTGVLNAPMRPHYDQQVVEHVAAYAAERGDVELEVLCDEVLAGRENIECIFDEIAGDDELAEDVAYKPWRTRQGDE